MCRVIVFIFTTCLFFRPAGWAATLQETATAELEAVRSAILKNDYDRASERSFAYYKAVLEIHRNSEHSQAIPKDLKYTPSTVDNSYLLLMVEQVKHMQASGDTLSTARYASTLQRALNEERMRSLPAPAQQLEEAENRLIGASRLQRYAQLPLICQIAVDAGANEKAWNYANELLVTAASVERDWPAASRGGVVYYGHVVAGRVALRTGDVKEARRHLSEAGKTYAATIMVIQGPDKRAIGEFLRAGEKDAVLAYLKDCAKAWKLDNGQTAEWTGLIEQGKLPWFARDKPR